MKYLILLFALFISACGAPPSTVITISNTAKSLYLASGATSIHVMQADIPPGSPTMIGSPVVSGTVLAINLIEGCSFQVDVFDHDPVNADFWITQPITFEYEQGLFTCGTQMQCGNYTAAIVGDVVEATFTCTPV